MLMRGGKLLLRPLSVKAFTTAAPQRGFGILSRLLHGQKRNLSKPAAPPFVIGMKPLAIDVKPHEAEVKQSAAEVKHPASEPVKPVDTQALLDALRKNRPSRFLTNKKSHHKVQEETVKYILDETHSKELTTHAQRNLATWAKHAQPAPQRVEVVAADWGVVAQKMTNKHGKMYAVLNMANPHFVGGDFLGGGSAQEENMFARTTCPRHVVTEEAAHVYLDMDDIFRYDQQMCELINGQTLMSPAELKALSKARGQEIKEAHKVYIDTQHPEVCFRGPEVFVKLSGSSFFEDGRRSEYVALGAGDGSFNYLPEDQVFPFYELRSAALDLNHPQLHVNWKDEKFLAWFRKETKKRIDAQLDTAILHGIRNLVLCPFGCGSFLNKASEVAKLYRQALAERAEQFDHVVFAVYYPGFGPNNYPAFASELDGLALGPKPKPSASRKMTPSG